MKRNSKKLLTLLLAGALCAATVGGVTTLVPAQAATAKTYLLTDIFKAGSDAKIGAETIGSEEAQTTKFTFVKSDVEEPEYDVEFDNDLALKWFAGKNDARYLGFTFAFADMNFTDISFKVEATPYQAVAEDKVINTIKFTKVSETEVGVKVYAGEEEPTDVTSYNVSATADMKVQLGAGNAEGEFSVKVNDTVVGSFSNIGATYADNGEVDTLVISATPAETATETAVYFKELNGQSFNNVTGDTSKSVTDNAAPVLIVNQEVSSFLLGTAFNLEYLGVDVLKDSVTIGTSDKKYYQYNPADETIEGTNISTSTYFMDTVYYLDGEGKATNTAEGNTATSVWREEGKEYLSVWFDLGDDTFTSSVGSEATDDNEKARYELAWYVDASKYEVATKQVGTDTRDYILLDRNDEGPTYTGIVLDDTNKKNVYAKADGTTEDYEESLLKVNAQNFIEELEEKAKEVYAGSNSEIQIPTIDWLIDDNNGHKALSFTISYKTPTSTSASTASSKKYNTLEIPTASEGTYEFKIFASDAVGNTMKYYLDGALVEVTSSNVWDIEEIPSFTFVVDNKEIKTADSEDNDTLDTKILEESYTMSEVKIEGVSNDKLGSEYKLFQVTDLGSNAAKKLSEIKFEALKEKANELIAAELAETAITEIDYMDIYLEAFKQLAAEKLGNNVDLTNAFKEINVYNSNIPEDDEAGQWHNQFNWSATSRRFTAAEEGLYIIIADYYDEDLKFVDRVPAYQLIEVSEEEDTIKGVSEWLENNLVSIILFSIAGVLAIVIVILLFVKPSNETLEDVDKKAKRNK